ncbi:M18 family aminopeptidase [Candidatus Spongiihabitans sp.]|uniref:M18 family aminopeptidase n=1 Tax=Candidatus Spongiihabitans sp. TaxID=3101308 RepID=UPI003C7C7C38
MPESIHHFLNYLSRSPTPYHAVANIAETLETAGYSRLRESDSWPKLATGKYYLTRNDSALIAFKLAQPPAEHGFRLIGAHTDSPCLKIKPNAITVNHGYAKLGVEVYGGALLNPWFDRDLALAGRVTVQTKAGAIDNFLINIDQPIAFIPSLAIHLDREANEHRGINKQTHLPAVICRADKDSRNFEALLKQWLQQQYPELAPAKILAFELSLYDHQPPRLVGLEREFIASARLDNLLSCHAAVEALLNANQRSNQVIALNDHEEVGSASTSGAQGSLLHSALSRICAGDENLQRAISRSMLVSADNAHGVHPNYPEAHEPAHQPLINNGPVIKINHNQRYATNSETAAVFKAVCDDNKIPYQVVVVRSDMRCGSTIGPITATRLGVRTVDVGVPQLGMHSIRELAGVKDVAYLTTALKGFLEMKRRPF